jgi:hypothetical protein
MCIRIALTAVFLSLAVGCKRKTSWPEIRKAGGIKKLEENCQEPQEIVPENQKNVWKGGQDELPPVVSALNPRTVEISQRKISQ